MAKKTLLMFALVLVNNVMLFAQSKTLPLVKKSMVRRLHYVSYQLCPKGWVSYKGSPSCYKVSSQPTNSWYEARKACLSMESDLVKISSAQENNYVTMLAHTYFPASSDFAWIGMIAEELPGNKQGKFHWVDGTPVAKQYTNWNKNEPNNYKGRKEYCANIYITKNDGMKWNDIPCVYSTKIPYVCEKERAERV